MRGVKVPFILSSKPTLIWGMCHRQLLQNITAWANTCWMIVPPPYYSSYYLCNWQGCHESPEPSAVVFEPAIKPTSRASLAVGTGTNRRVCTCNLHRMICPHTTVRPTHRRLMTRHIVWSVCRIKRWLVLKGKEFFTVATTQNNYFTRAMRSLLVNRGWSYCAWALRLFLFHTHYTPVVSSSAVHWDSVHRGGRMFCERV
jgi:hypothetical protein